MDISLEQIVSLLLALGGLGAAIFTNQKYKAAKEQLVEFVGDLADFLALVYAMGKAEKCDPEALKALVSKTEEIWTDVQALGPTFAALLAQKSSLAEALENKREKEAS